MKIALFASAFHPSLGGVEEVTRQLAHALKRAEHEVLIITQRWPRDLPAFEEFEGLKIHRFAFRAPMNSRRRLARWRSAVMWRLTAPAIQREIIALLRRENVEIINVHCVSTNAIYARQAAQKLDLPFVVTMHGELTMDSQQTYQRNEKARAMMRQTLQSADFLTGCSGQTVREAEEFLSEPFGARSRVIYSGIRLADFQNPQKPAKAHPRPYILGIGRHVEQKGFDVLLRAYALLKNQTAGEIPDLILAGDGPLKPQLEALSEQLGLKDRVGFPGRAARPEAVALFQGCEFFVLPSRHEPMGIVNLEAMAAGKAVIASRVGGVPELVQNEENGLLVAPDDAQSLAHALARLVDDAPLRKKLGECGAVRVQRFDWDAIAAQYLESYTAAQNARNRR